MIITSSSNEKIKYLRKLMKDSSLRREAGVYITEGERIVNEVPAELVTAVYVSESYTGERPMCEEMYVLSDSVFASVSDTKNSQGILAVVRMKAYTYEAFADDAIAGKQAFLLVLDRLQDPGNVGTILRTAEGAGVTGVILSADSCDLYNPKVVRSTMGSIYRVPVYVADDTADVVRKVKAAGVTCFAAHLSGKDFYEEDFTGSVAFLIGNEGRGLSEEVSAEADRLIKIPMCGKLESLNAAVSTAVICYETLRQRR